MDSTARAELDEAPKQGCSRSNEVEGCGSRKIIINKKKFYTMGRIKKGVLNGYRGKIGNIVGYYDKGQYVLRTLPEKVRNPRTEAQMEQRLKVKTAMSFLHVFSGWLKTGYKEYAGNGRTGFNLAMSQVLKEGIGGTYPNYTITYADVKVSRGSLCPLRDAAFSISAADGAVWIWRNNSVTDDSCAGDDVVMTLVYNADKCEACYEKEAGAREDERAAMVLPTSWTGDTIEVWASVISADGKRVSDSVYLGEFTAV